MTPEQHARQYDGEYYRKQFGAVDKLDPLYPYTVQIPSPEIHMHMSTIRDVAAKANNILELGPFLGTGSTLAIMQGLLANESLCWGPSPPSWVTVDIIDHMLPWLKPKYSEWNLVIGDSASPETAEKVRKIIDEFDFVFIDTVHTKEHLAKELELYSPMAADNCTWLFHDTWMLGVYNPMTDAIKEFAAKDGRWEYSDISKENNGLGALLPV